MINKTFTCIECPKSCRLSVEIDNCRVVGVSGNKCPKGEVYARSEVENPLRIFTSTVLTEKLPLKMLPVRSDKPIPKSRIAEAVAEVKKIKVSKPARVGDVIVDNFLGLEVNLVATRNTLEY
jgi:CxxC motif-containing protein